MVRLGLALFLWARLLSLLFYRFISLKLGIIFQSNSLKLDPHWGRCSPAANVVSLGIECFQGGIWNMFKDISTVFHWLIGSPS